MKLRASVTRAGAVGALASLLIAAPARAQVSFTNLAQAQAGNVPFTEPPNRTDLYNQARLDAVFGPLRFGARYEVRENSERVLTYREISQRYAEWTEGNLRGRVGNFYTLVGRGLIHRSWELPGVVIDQPGSRSEFGFARDVDGVLVEGEAGPFSAHAFTGEPNDGTVSPSPDEPFPRYIGQVSGAQAALDVWRGARLGAGYVRTSNVESFTGISRQDELGTGFLEADPLALAGITAVSLPIYAEYAQLKRSFTEWWSLERGGGVPHALYVATNLIAGPLAVSAEWKDYRLFRIGTNDPPSLVREHAFALLNRATHVLLADDEHGYQFEGSYAVPGWGTATANHSRADGIVSSTPRRYFENYFELRAAPERVGAVELTLFFDKQQDTFSRISERNSWGGSGTVRARRDYSLTVDLERSDATRFFAPAARRSPDSYSDQRVSVSVARADWGSIGILGERTSDPVLRSSKRPNHDRRFFATTVTARLAERHTATLLVGERRGGRACTAGTCYEVQDFKGAELRLTTRY
ncbi:MAG: hypothetical protein HOP15_16260 [Planctomycetes bacterium]|nr:hypothetical protein [Planctomycetota bacterium]